MLDNSIKIILLFQLTFACAKGILYSASPGKCSSGGYGKYSTTGISEAARTTLHDSNDCRSICDQDEDCTGYNTKSESKTWCDTYYSKYLVAFPADEYLKWTCFVKEDPDYKVTDSVCFPLDFSNRYPDLNCKERCDISSTCTGFAFSWGKQCSTHTREGIDRLEVPPSYPPLVFSDLRCVTKRRIDYTFIFTSYLHLKGTRKGNEGEIVYLTVHGEKGVIEAGNLARPGYDLPNRVPTEFTWTLRDVGHVHKIAISRKGWISGFRLCPERYLTMFTEKDPLPVLFLRRSEMCLIVPYKYSLEFYRV